MTTRVWVDASAGASGDMLLGALVGAGVPIEVLREAVHAVAPEPVLLSVEEVHRAGFAATRCHVAVADSTTARTWREVRTLLDAAPLDDAVRAAALAVFARLAEAEGRVHGHDPEEVHFHEVGALDAVADVVGACAGLVHLGGGTLPEVVVSPVAVGSGQVTGAHGVLPVPPPAVVELLRGVPTFAGPGAHESCTPTGAAVLATVGASWGPQPAMVVDAVGVGAGGRDPATHANVLRLLVGEAAPTSAPAVGDPRPVVLETNVDDLDPRLWPAVIAALLAAGASDAWLTPILMKKGRPAHTLSVLVAAEHADAVRRTVLRETSAIGLRELRLDGKHALEREMVVVEVDGQAVDVKLARLDGAVVNAQPEWEHVARAAEALGVPAKVVLARAAALAAAHLEDRPRDV